MIVQVVFKPADHLFAPTGSAEKGSSSLSVPQSISALPCTPCSLRIIFINDVYELDNLPRFATCVREQSTENTVVLLAGDFVAPSLLSQLDNARGMVDCLNRCGLQYVCFGNHEADIAHPGEARASHRKPRRSSDFRICGLTPRFRRQSSSRASRRAASSGSTATSAASTWARPPRPCRRTTSSRSGARGSSAGSASWAC